MIKNLVKTIVKKLVDHPDQVTVNEIESAGGKKAIQLHVSPQDVSTIIGGDGRIFRALRLLVHAISTDQKDLVIDSAE